MHRTIALPLVSILLGASLAAAQQGSASRTAPAAAAPAVAVPPGYAIGPEDVLGIVFWREAELSGDVTVRPDGRITLAVIGEMAAAGLRPEELQQQIQAKAKTYVQDPNVAVVVRQINSRKIFVTGRVTTPGAYALRGPLTVMQALALAGGINDYADAKNINVLRIDGSKTKGFKFNYKDVSNGKKLEQNILLQPGDTVVVP
jgi:polysaccharide export outer membrane protein